MLDAQFQFATTKCWSGSKCNTFCKIYTLWLEYTQIEFKKCQYFEEKKHNYKIMLLGRSILN